MKHVKGTATGVYGTKEIEWELFHNDSARTLIIFFHGCCSGPYDVTPTFYETATQKFSENAGISTAFYQSSRKLQKHLLDPAEYADYNAFIQRAFGGKTQSDEYQDGRSAVVAILDSVQHEFEEIIFVGFSLGGLVASVCSTQFPVEKLFLFGSAQDFILDESVPIAGSGIEFLPISEAAKKFTGHVTIVRGTEDTTAVHARSLELWEAFEQAETRTLSEWRGVEHRFRQRFGKDDPKLWTEIIQFIESRVQ